MTGVPGVPGAPSLENVLPVFLCPRRPNIGTDGRLITLRANHFQITMPRGFLHHYDITITPDKCPRKINREIIETMVQSYSKIFGTQKPVFDGRKNMYTRDDLPIGRDKVCVQTYCP
jgi:eukaryotic translation initiation factor 2C